MHGNDIFMYGNYILIKDNEDFAPGIILLPQTFSWESGLYKCACMEMKFPRMKCSCHDCFMHEIFLTVNNCLTSLKTNF